MPGKLKVHKEPKCFKIFVTLNIYSLWLLFFQKSDMILHMKTTALYMSYKA